MYIDEFEAAVKANGYTILPLTDWSLDSFGTTPDGFISKLGSMDYHGYSVWKLSKYGTANYYCGTLEKTMRTNVSAPPGAATLPTSAAPTQANAILDFIEPILCQRPLGRNADLAQQLQTAQAKIADLSSQLNQTNSNLAASQAQLSTAVANYNSCTANMGKDETAYQTQINDLQAQKTQLTTQISDLNTQVQTLLHQISIQSQKTGIFNMLPPTSKDSAMSYWDKYQPVDATYGARPVGFGSNQVQALFDVKAFALEGQNDFRIIKRVNDASANVMDVLKEFPNLNIHQACDVAYMRVAAAFNKPYLNDSAEWGVSEYWEFASETECIETRGVDCDGMMSYRNAGYRAAGIPEELLRCTAGQTQGGLGHATNHYLPSDLSWRHCNSTSVFHTNESVLSLPHTNEPTDMLGIRYVWFSFSQSKCWAQYTTDAHEASATSALAKHPFMRHIAIRPRIKP